MEAGLRRDSTSRWSRGKLRDTGGGRSERTEADLRQETTFHCSLRVVGARERGAGTFLRVGSVFHCRTTSFKLSELSS